MQHIYHSIQQTPGNKSLLNHSFDRETILSKTIHSYFQLARMIIEKAELLEKREDKIILVADDEPLTFELITEYFKDADLPYKVLRAETGSSAFKLATTEIPDLIITDWLMPVYDGLALIKKLKATPETKEIPVIMVTGAEVPDEEFNKVLTAGAIDFIRKPIVDDELIARVKAALALHDSLKEIKLQQESVKFNNPLLNLLKDASPSPIFYADMEGYLFGCNEGFANFLNREIDHMIGKPLRNFLVFGEGKPIESYFQTIQNPGIIFNFEVTRLTETGAIQNLLLSCIGFGKTAVDIVVGSMIDITEIVTSKKDEFEKSHRAMRLQYEQDLFQLQDELELNKRELKTQIELLIHSRNSKANLIDTVGKLQPFLTPEGKTKFYSVLKQLHWELNGEVELSAQKKFDAIHMNFYSFLENICPEITKNEKRLCAYFRMNHSSTDIARITNRSLNSVNVAFARIRAKLQVQNNKDLKTLLLEAHS